MSDQPKSDETRIVDLPFARSDRPTVALSPHDLAAAGAQSWPWAIAALERVDRDAVYALRLGLLTQLQIVLQQMTAADAPAALVVRARALIESLAHQPWER